LQYQTDWQQLHGRDGLGAAQDAQIVILAYEVDFSQWYQYAELEI
jgi:hypothetical protein